MDFGSLESKLSQLCSDLRKRTELILEYCCLSHLGRELRKLRVRALILDWESRMWWQQMGACLNFILLD